MNTEVKAETYGHLLYAQIVSDLNDVDYNRCKAANPSMCFAYGEDGWGFLLPCDYVYINSESVLPELRRLLSQVVFEGEWLRSPRMATIGKTLPIREGEFIEGYVQRLKRSCGRGK